MTLPRVPAPATTPAAPRHTMNREQAVLCPALGAMIAEGGVPLDARGDFSLERMHDCLVEGLNTSPGFAGLCLGLGPFSNTLRDVLGNILGGHVNALDLREGMAQHPGDSGVLRPGQFDEAAFDALVSHGQDLVREGGKADGKIVDGTMTSTQLASAIAANVRRAGSALAYAKGLPTSMFEFASLLDIFGTRDATTGERTLSIRVMRDLYELKKLPPRDALYARPPTTVADLTETMSALAAAMPLDSPTELVHHAAAQAFHEVSGAIHTALGLGRRNPASAAAPVPPSALPRAPSAFVPPHTIEEVLEALGRIVDEAISSGGRIGYFAGLYSSVTSTIRRSIIAGAFQDNARMARLDVVFATRFLQAFHAYRAGGAPGQSYAVAFEALGDPSLLVVQHQLLALNAHIFLDLGIACATVAPGPLLPSLRADFDTINDILQKFICLLEDKIGEISPLIGDLEKLGMSFENTLIGFSLKVARDAAWTFADQLAQAPQRQWPALIAAQDRATAGASAFIRAPGGAIQLVLEAIQDRESKDVPGNIIIVGE